jgi:hypothetical protein
MQLWQPDVLIGLLYAVKATDISMPLCTSSCDKCAQNGNEERAPRLLQVRRFLRGVLRSLADGGLCYNELIGPKPPRGLRQHARTRDPEGNAGEGVCTS